MNTPVQITFHNVSRSAVIEASVSEGIARLESTHRRITGCRVIIDQPHRHHREGNPFEVRIDLRVPGRELAVKRRRAVNLGLGDVSTLVHDAFDEILRQLEEFVQCRRRLVKAHQPTPRARVARLFPEDGYGFLETRDGREVFFHGNSVLGSGFGRLRIGTEVTFVEEPGDKGPQASTVRVVGQRRGLAASYPTH
jgi:cold shock CspA family protein